MNINIGWTPLITAVLAFAVGYGVLQNQVTVLKEEQTEIRDTLNERSKYIVSFAELRAEVVHNSAELQLMRPLTEDLRKTLASLDKTLLGQQVQMSSIKDDVKEIKQATVKAAISN